LERIATYDTVHGEAVKNKKKKNSNYSIVETMALACQKDSYMQTVDGIVTTVRVLILPLTLPQKFGFG